MAAFIVTAAVSIDLWAHHLPSERELFIQVDERGAIALWQIRVHGSSATAFAKVWDQDHNGAWSDAEAAGAATTLTAKSMSGVQISWDGFELKPGRSRPRLVDERPRSSTLGANLVVPLSLPTVEGDQHQLLISVAARTTPLTVSISTKHPWQIETAAGARITHDHQSLETPIVVEPNGQLSVRLARAANAQGSRGEPK